MVLPRHVPIRFNVSTSTSELLKSTLSLFFSVVLRFLLHCPQLRQKLKLLFSLFFWIKATVLFTCCPSNAIFPLFLHVNKLLIEKGSKSERIKAYIYKTAVLSSSLVSFVLHEMCFFPFYYLFFFITVKLLRFAKLWFLFYLISFFRVLPFQPPPLPSFFQCEGVGQHGSASKLMFSFPFPLREVHVFLTVQGRWARFGHALLYLHYRNAKYLRFFFILVSLFF